MFRFRSAKLAQRQARTNTRANRVVVAAQMQENTRRQAFGLAAAALTLVMVPGAKADLIEELKAKSTANAELHNKQRLATSYANFARSRTVTDGSCKFPGNVLGCDVGLYAGDVKYIADDTKIQCEGKDAGKCASKVSIPQRNQ